MRRIITLIVLALLLTGAVLAWKMFGSGTAFSEKTHTFIIEEGKTDRANVVAALEKNEVISSPSLFSFLGSRMGIWNRIRPGKYEVKKGESLVGIARMLKNGRLAEFKLVINRIRTREELAHLISKNFKPDSVSVMQYLNSDDSLQKFGVDTNTLFTLIIPDTYLFYWNTPLEKILRRLADTRDAFWKRNQRLEKANELHFTPEQVYTLASIVDEETNYESDKYKIASVYINRVNAGMPLQADPTIKFAMKDFTLRRILKKFLDTPSPYNTYRRKGLPPGPICTASPKTLDIVLTAPKTDYLYFVAKSDFSGYHHFSSNFTEHLQYAREYQKALTEYLAKKQQNPAP
ncbi:MAG: endolytic transglycosylase MltG [Chitinophagaceae bacterium]|nr:endolytic transglycosylase MltG [Chitinophagaceae bacterium]